MCGSVKGSAGSVLFLSATPPPPPSLKITLSTSSFMLGTTHEDGASPRLVDGHPPCVASSSSRQAKLV